MSFADFLELASDDTHRHMCANGHIFEHTRPAWDTSTREEYAARHTCSVCGDGPNYYKYEDDTPTDIEISKVLVQIDVMRREYSDSESNMLIDLVQYTRIMCDDDREKELRDLTRLYSIIVNDPPPSVVAKRAARA